MPAPAPPRDRRSDDDYTHVGRGVSTSDDARPSQRHLRQSRLHEILGQLPIAGEEKGAARQRPGMVTDESVESVVHVDDRNRVAVVHRNYRLL
jgi:hypothetical protein